jgi:hypothetical protein
MAVDVDRMLQEALAKHGIRLDPQDPAVVLVTLNRLVLEDAARDVTADIRTATKQFEEAADRVQARLGAAVAARLKKADSGAVAPLGLKPRTWLAVGLCSGAGLFSVGVAVGRWLLR